MQKSKEAEKFKAVLFDKDGVLIDSMDMYLRAFDETLKRYGAGSLSRERFAREFWGIRAELNINKLFKDSPESKRKEIYGYYEKKRAGFENLVKIYPSTVEILAALREKYKLGIITSTNKKLALKLLKDFGILKYFDVVVGGDEAEPKPSPDSIFRACKFLGTRPKEALYVGDTDADIGAGKAAGCMTVIITTSKTREELKNIKGILIIDDLKELKNIL